MSKPWKVKSYCIPRLPYLVCLVGQLARWSLTHTATLVSEGYTKVVRLTKKGWTYKGAKFVQDVAKYFYDCNF